MSCMHRFQSNSTQEALSNNSWYKISIRTVARNLFGSLRQNAHLIHMRISILRRLCMRMVRRILQDQSLDLPSEQGVFIGLAKHNGVIGCYVSDGSWIIVTRQNLAFDPHLYSFHQKPLSAPAWQSLHNLTKAAAQGSTQQIIPSTDQPEAQEFASSE